MKKKLYIGSNLKMYKTVSETVRYLQRLEENTKEIDKDQVQLFILPSYTSLAAATEAVDTERIRIGAQNMSWADEGQFTGEISPVMLEETGADLVMIGHSERRHVFGETDREENQKVKAARLFCVSARRQGKRKTGSVKKSCGSRSKEACAAFPRNSWEMCGWPMSRSGPSEWAERRLQQITQKKCTKRSRRCW